MKFDFSKEPGREEKNRYEYSNYETTMSIIMPFYNEVTYLDQTINSILNQTFPNFELLIIDDGSTNETAIKKLQEIEKMDKRIKLFHKNNEGASKARDYGETRVSSQSKYLVFCDSDDLLNETFLETGFWTLETNTKASWAYTDSVGIISPLIPFT